MKLEKYLIQAAKLALLDSHQRKTWLHAAVGIRADGAIVYARNGDAECPAPRHHAETRLCRKLGQNASLVIIVRVNRRGDWRLSKPCPNCELALRRAGVKRVVWTVQNGQIAQERYAD